MVSLESEEEFTGHIPQTTSTQLEPCLVVPKTLSFLENTAPQEQNITIFNPNVVPLQYRVLSTAPSHYHAKPKGKLEPTSATQLTITLRKPLKSPKEDQIRVDISSLDHFMIWKVLVISTIVSTSAGLLSTKPVAFPQLPETDRSPTDRKLNKKVSQGSASNNRSSSSNINDKIKNIKTTFNRQKGLNPIEKLVTVSLLVIFVGTTYVVTPPTFSLSATDMLVTNWPWITFIFGMITMWLVWKL